MVKGIFHFMLTDPWPAITWAVVDYYRQPKPAYDALRRAMQPVLPTAEVTREYKAGTPTQFNFYVVNDLDTQFNSLEYSWQLTKLLSEPSFREPTATGQGVVNVALDSVTRPILLRTPALSPGLYRLSIHLFTSDRSPLAENFYILTFK
jgi:beta-mannosidase